MLKSCWKLSFLGSLAWFGLVPCTMSSAKDYFLTIGGGYSPEGNQASMEANVLFFDELLVKQKEGEEFEHKIFFADGNDPSADVQVTADQGPNASVRRLLSMIFDWKLDELDYRNHRVPEISGSNEPDDFQAGMDQIAESLTSGDRFFIYVTAHGGSDKQKKGGHDTSIYGWNRRSVRASEFATWLDKVPSDVPVYMVMAQCYCGGYANTIFSAADREQGLASGLRCGFFAQQHNLPAAGCRPDISNDQEYSSYFWGAIRGQTRNGQAITDADRDGDGRVSFAEAHIHAVLTGDTIDIPIRCSEVLLRAYSQDRSEYMRDAALASCESDDDATPLEGNASAELCDSLLDAEGTLGDLVAVADFVNAEVVKGLTEQLGIPLDATVQDVENRLREAQSMGRGQRGRGRGMGQSYRELQKQLRDDLLNHCEELAKADSFDDLEKLGVDLAALEAQVQQFPAHNQLLEQIAERQKRRDAASRAEFDQVRMKRLLQSLDTIVLAHNLPHIATAEVVERYESMMKLERASL